SFAPDLYAFNPNGTIKWSYQADNCGGEDVPSSPAIGADGTVYAAATCPGGGAELALDPDGSLEWESHYGGSPTAPSIGGDGTIYFGSGSDNPASRFALNPDGTLEWEDGDPGERE